MRFLATMGKCECIDALNDQSFADVLCKMSSARRPLYSRVAPLAQDRFRYQIPENYSVA